MLNELAIWWTNRRITDDSNDPLTTLIGGVDYRGTARTTNLTPATASFNAPITPPAAAGVGRSYFVQAFGIPDPPDVAEVYSLIGIAHFYHTDSTWLSRYTTGIRSPSSTTTTEIRTGLSLDGDPVILIVGVSSITIDWILNLSMLEL